MATFISLSVTTTPMKLINSGRFQGALLTVESTTIRYRYDGGLPDSATGHAVVSGAGFMLKSGEEVERCWLVSTSGTAQVMVTLE